MRSGPPRNMAAPAGPWTMGRQEKWATAEPGGTQMNLTEPHGTLTGGYYPIKSTLFVACFCAFAPLVPPNAPIPNVSLVSKRLVLVGGWVIGARRKAIAQWATAEHGGPPRDHGQWGDTENGPPRNLTEHRGAPTGGITPSNPPFFTRFPDFSFAPLSQHLTFRWCRNAFHLSEGRHRGATRQVNVRTGTADNRGTPTEPQ